MLLGFGSGLLRVVVLALGTPSLFRERKKGEPCLAYYGPRARLSAGDCHPRNAEERRNLRLRAALFALGFVGVGVHFRVAASIPQRLAMRVASVGVFFRTQVRRSRIRAASAEFFGAFILLDGLEAIRHRETKRGDVVAVIFFGGDDDGAEPQRAGRHRCVSANLPEGAGFFDAVGCLHGCNVAYGYMSASEIDRKANILFGRFSRAPEPVIAANKSPRWSVS